MPSLISTDEISSFTGDYKNLFDTFKRKFVVIKEPQRKVLKNDINADFLYYGYNSPSQQPNTLVSYDIVSGVYSGMIRYPANAKNYANLTDLRNIIPEADIQLKVEEDAKNFITKDKTEKIMIDDSSFKVVGGHVVRYFFGVKLYVFNLEQVV